VIDLNDIYHLPDVDRLIDQLATDGPGLTVVAGFDPALSQPQGGFLPSGRAGLFRILLRRILSARLAVNPAAHAIVVAEAKEKDKEAIRLPRDLSRRVEVTTIKPPDDPAEGVAAAAVRRPDLLSIERLDRSTVPAALQAAQSGLRILAQLDTVFVGAEVLRHLLDLGAQLDHLSAVQWVVTIQRMATLCPICKRREILDQAQIALLQRRYQQFDASAPYLNAQGCVNCGYTGRKGEVAAFDIFHAMTPTPRLLRQSSDIAMEDYLLQLAVQGQVSLDDAVRFEAEQLRRTYVLVAAGDRTAVESQHALQRKVLELETSNRVLQQRTEALISLEQLGSALITSTDLSELAATVCRLARNLCGAERAILYFLRSEIVAEVLAVSGWSTDLLRQQLDAELVFGPDRGALRDNAEPTPYTRWPPGVPYREPDLEGARLYQGLRLPLVAQDKLVGLLIVHPTTKRRFTPGEVALLRTLANQAALAIQRAGLVQELRAKIVQLETAQAELVKKERLERELELAHQVQQQLLPRTFPVIPGYAFAARNLPARQVGGDFYDVIPVDKRRFGVVIADVSDKGMPAALFMALTRSVLMAEAQREVSPRTVLTSVNRLLLALGDAEMFVAVFYGVVDTRTRTLTYTRAGHDRPLLLRDGSVRALAGDGTVLGLLDSGSLSLTEEHIVLQPGDKLVLHTDGLTDVLNTAGETFGLERLEQLLQDHAQRSPIDLCDVTFSALADYRGPAEQYDDMAMLVVAVE
jgi:serine phosphatase RsbU (regulator of sigma subunit)